MAREGLVVFITGCSAGGLGAALAIESLKLGHRLVATARSLASLDYLSDTSESNSLLKLALDVTSIESIDNAIAATLKTFGRIDILVNNAGYNRIGHTEAVPDTEIFSIMETNFWGAIRMTRRTMEIFREGNAENGGRQGGRIVQISSMGGRVVYPGNASYHASKHALEAFTETLSLEVDPAWNIKFLIVEPGGMKSNYAKEAFAEGKITTHPAYSNPELPVNQVIEWSRNVDPENAGFASVEKVAKVIFKVLQDDQMPLRLVVGADAYGAIESRETAKMDELRKWKDVSESVSVQD